ncbi:MAG: transposase domain-containing protein [Sandaracinobacter sp.]
MPKEWFSTRELAELRLPDMPTSNSKVAELAGRECWDLRADKAGQPLARERKGRGGGREFHWTVLPYYARLELVKRGVVVEKLEQLPKPVSDADPGTAWQAATDAARGRAKARFEAVLQVLALCEGGANRDLAVSQVARTRDLARSSLFNWLNKVAGEPRQLWLPLLLDECRGGGRKAEIPAALWTFYESWWLRQSKPTHADAYRRTREEAKRLGITIIPSAKTFQRRAEAIPPEVVKLKRHGTEATRLMVPPQERSVADQHALALVNSDGHKWDLRVRFPDGTEGRPITVAIQDIYSRKFLAWRHGKGESANLVRLAFGDLFRNWGFPTAALQDNGRAFASKWITGGAKNRYRYSINPDDPLGLLTRFGIDIHWALPKRGSSKPIERGFRDFAQIIARHAAFEGAWLGNSVANKPENYGTRVVEWADFVRVIDAEIAAHNARTGRTTEMARGRSFDEVFAESYASVPIAKASESQLRECLLSAEKVRAMRDTGAVKFMGNRYWTPAMANLAGQPLIIRYDPDDLHSQIHVYDAKGRFVLTAPIWEKSGFLTEDHGRARMKVERDLLKNARREAELRGLLSAQELAHRDLVAAGEPEAPAPMPKVLRLVRSRGATALKSEDVIAPSATPETPLIDRFVGAMRLRAVD